jgi:hypothetical protein
MALSRCEVVSVVSSSVGEAATHVRELSALCQTDWWEMVFLEFQFAFLSLRSE